MGYKLAGCDYLGGVEIDPKVAETYRDNLRPKYLFVEDIRDFNKREDLPEELYNLDILDGSPPCILFSSNRGKVREKSWGRKKKFAEGQEEQTLDDLPFVWCDTVAKLRPRVCLMENVEGLVKGNAKAYLARIVGRLRESGYESQVFILDAAAMGVPQSRRRCFVIGRRKDLRFPKLDLSFDEPEIPFIDIRDTNRENDLTDWKYIMWKNRRKGDRSLDDVSQRVQNKTSGFSCRFIYDNKPSPTLVTSRSVLFSFPRFMSDTEMIKAATFPLDYDYTGGNIVFFTGMSVPPLMTANIAYEINRQLFAHEENQ